MGCTASAENPQGPLSDLEIEAARQKSRAIAAASTQATYHVPAPASGKRERRQNPPPGVKFKYVDEDCESLPDSATSLLSGHITRAVSDSGREAREPDHALFLRRLDKQRKNLRARCPGIADPGKVLTEPLPTDTVMKLMGARDYSRVAHWVAKQQALKQQSAANTPNSAMSSSPTTIISSADVKSLDVRTFDSAGLPTPLDGRGMGLLEAHPMAVFDASPEDGELA